MIDRMSPLIREARAEDLEAILAVTERAFASHVEPTLVRLIYGSPNFVPGLSLVAERDGTIVGHVMLSYVDLVDHGRIHRVLSLAPLSVEPTAQRQGVGSRLVAAAVERADALGEPLVILEGSPRYYGRLGFEDARSSGIRFALPEWAPPNAGQVMKLSRYDPLIKGNVVYPAAFGAAKKRHL
jgi:putative acetyltransferase